MKTRVLVLGATGYVGRHLVRALAGSAWATPVAAARRATAATHGEALALDATHGEALRLAVDEADAVVNCVAGRPADMVAVAEGLRLALRHREGPPIRLVNFSSMAAYGSATGEVAESYPLNGDLGPYAAAKARAEQILADVPGVATLRPGCVYGPGSPQWTLRIARLLRARRIGDLGAAGDGCSNLVYIDDVVQAALAALRLPTAGGRAFNLVMPQAPTWNEYFVAFARALGAVPVWRIGARRLALETRLAAPAFKLAEIAARRVRPGLAERMPPAIPPGLARLWRQDIRLVPDAATRELGVAWTPLADGIARSLPA